MALKTITGKAQNPDGNNAAFAKITAQLSQACTIPGSSETLPNLVTVTAAADGTFTLTLQANNDLTPTGTYYTIAEVGGQGGSYTYTIVVPQTAGPFVISNIQAAAPTPSPPAALDSAVVHLANPEIVTGDKYFQSGDPWHDPKADGAKGDLNSLINVTCTSGSAAIVTVTPTFAQSDVGKLFDLWGGTGPGITGTQSGQLVPIAPTGKEVTTQGAYHCRIVDGKIVEDWEVWACIPIPRQMGIVLNS